MDISWATATETLSPRLLAISNTFAWAPKGSTSSNKETKIDKQKHQSRFYQFQTKCTMLSYKFFDNQQLLSDPVHVV